jgi:hypothetical protein
MSIENWKFKDGFKRGKILISKGGRGETRV